ncbi:DUF6547 family protein [Enterococcus sp. BWR-S5]|uniref:DUF6547 family protein n=1 Tax=Enterococcus sp. BWR-S5 TaxID=2787714 RepID=UPI001925156E|nr:DUF6547 family protein [Enterococcus sp. BWR-S5]MBL1226675.1 hypothetical protein [Enterococcus sp. BWR-S5]
MGENELDSYKELVDGFVAISERDYRKVIENKKSTFMDKLNDEEKEVLFEWLSEARTGGIHDMLVYLNDLQNLEDLTIIKGKKKLPKEPFGTEIFYDYMCRLKGDSWPENE